MSLINVWKKNKTQHARVLFRFVVAIAETTKNGLSGEMPRCFFRIVLLRLPSYPNRCTAAIFFYDIVTIKITRYVSTETNRFPPLALARNAVDNDLYLLWYRKLFRDVRDGSEDVRGHRFRHFGVLRRVVVVIFVEFRTFSSGSRCVLLCHAYYIYNQTRARVFFRYSRPAFPEGF